MAGSPSARPNQRKWRLARSAVSRETCLLADFQAGYPTARFFVSRETRLLAAQSFRWDRGNGQFDSDRDLGVPDAAFAGSHQCNLRDTPNFKRLEIQSLARLKSPPPSCSQPAEFWLDTWPGALGSSDSICPGALNFSNASNSFR